ncbi:PAS domain-containing protein [uncultured Roseobacter sp.]|uniref:helix-turn-helix transcriptional regulator n=1 Tax=uncultured Roseobacter sp. TaxID=114847 RepID=UPI00261C6B5B|nr:PAS domain-containing protein [uncultured Roseobacter sp.]
MTLDLPETANTPQTDLINICDALVKLFDPFAEVVLHDLKTQTISHIAGQLSHRQIGDPSFIDGINPRKDYGPVFGPYRKTNPDGRQIKSISILFRNDVGNPASLLCINMDTSRFAAAHADLSRFISIPSDDHDNPLADDWLDTLNRFVADWRIEKGISGTSLSVENRRRLLKVLIERDVFDRSKAADAVARAIGVSRATVYNDLRTLGALAR